MFCRNGINITIKGKVLSEYRQSLYYEGVRKLNEYTGNVSKPGFAREVVDKVLDEGGELSVPQLMHSRSFSEIQMIYQNDGFVGTGIGIVARH